MEQPQAEKVTGNGTSNPVVVTTPAEIPVPSAYASLGAVHGYNPPPPEEVRLYITGMAGEGKTTFVSSIPNSLILDYEHGARGIPSARSPYVIVENFEHHKKIIDQLMNDAKEGRRQFQRIIIDTHDGWVELEGRHLLAEKNKGAKTYEDIGELGKKGHGHSLLQGRCRRLLGRLEDAGYSWAVVGHLTRTTETDAIKDTERTVIRPILSKGYVGPVVRSTELHVTIYSSVSMEKADKVVGGKVYKNAEEKAVTRYFLYTRPTEAKAMDGKRRGVPTLPGRMEVPMVDGWKVLKEAYEKAVEESKSKIGEIK